MGLVLSQLLSLVPAAHSSYLVNLQLKRLYSAWHDTNKLPAELLQSTAFSKEEWHDFANESPDQLEAL